MNFHKIRKKKGMLSKRQHDTSFLSGTLSSCAFMLAMMTFFACGMTVIDLPEKEGKAPQAISEDGRGNLLPEERDFRGWIHSVSLFPPLVNNESTLHASSDWGPTGRPGMSLRYQWFVNGKKIVSEDSGLLPLFGLRSGDRVYAIAQLVRGDEKVIASQRSRSIVIQNRPPRLDAGLREMRKEGKYLVGIIAVSDPDGDAFTIHLLDGPSGLKLAPNGQVRWPLSEVTPGEHHLTIEMEDERGLGLRGQLLFSMGREERREGG